MSRPQPLIILGAGALGREVAEVVRAINAVGPTWEIAGYLDDAADAASAPGLSAAVLGTFDDVPKFADAQFVMAVATPRRVGLRAEVARRLGLPPDRFATLVHTSCSLAHSTTLPSFARAAMAFSSSARNPSTLVIH